MTDPRYWQLGVAALGMTVGLSVVLLGLVAVGLRRERIASRLVAAGVALTVCGMIGGTVFAILHP